MSLDHCRDLVERGDPDRALVTAGADEAAQAKLWPLWAFNLEVARAPWAAHEPLVAEMRLQFWADAVERLPEGGTPGHPVMEPLAEALGGAGAAPLAALVEARRRDVWREPFADVAALGAYLEATSAGLFWAAARSLGAPEAAEPVVRAYGWGAGLAAWLRAAPELSARGWAPLPEGADVAALARDGLSRIAEARRRRRVVPASAFAALAPGWQAAGILRRAARAPGRVAEGGLGPSEFARRGGLAWAGLTGRW
ncbi:squalene/phytoene synthase family protein [Solirhodobacter olei]|uniref:squalene/phytoene synthase family protein n=1 Tax=Solirhodobacter olei TaxID=2493082 RepID=UPI000FDA0E16|nr:squalene/phytoene synthase family protein [Solirhodobacter olei]